MTKTGILSIAAILFAAANLRLGVRVSVDGKMLDGAYSLAQLRECTAVSLAAAEELRGGRARLPNYERSFILSVSPAHGEEKALTDALIRGCEGVEVLDAVYCGAERMGNVQNARMLTYLLERDMPDADEIRTAAEYCAEGSAMPYTDMLEKIAEHTA